MSKKQKTLWDRLAEPFKPEEIEWRCGATNRDKTKCLALAYVTNRAIQNRLDEVAGVENWKESFREVNGGFVCSLSIRDGENGEWITKEDGASSTGIEPVKGGLSDSMKRAAVQFGIGRYLYDAEATWEPAKQIGKSTVLARTPTLKLKGKGQKIADVENIPNEPTTEPAEDRKVQVALKKLSSVETIDELQSVYMSLGSLKVDPEVMALKEQLKSEFLS